MLVSGRCPVATLRSSFGREVLPHDALSGECRQGRDSKEIPCGYVTAYEFDEKGFSDPGLTRLDFPNFPVSVDWFRFIMRNRRERNPEHSYDLVTGPVANDRVYTVITAYEAGFASETEAIDRLKPYRLADQYLFHTPAALRFLKAVTTVEVPR